MQSRETSSKLHKWMHQRMWNPYVASSINHEFLDGKVKGLEMVKTYFGFKVFSVFVYIVGDTLIDTGLSSHSEEFFKFVKNHDVKQVLLTHHHEDHSGNVGTLLDLGYDIYASEECANIVEYGFPIKFYEHIVASTPAPVTKSLKRITCDTDIKVSSYKESVTVIETPGHSTDHLSFLVPETGWLFCGDAILDNRIQFFRGDEDIHAHLVTLKKLIHLNCITSVFSGHTRKIESGNTLVKNRYEFLLNIKTNTLKLHQKGENIYSIVSKVIPKHQHLPPFLAWPLFHGDVSTHNMIRSVLFGPIPRPEILRAGRNRGKRYSNN